MERVLVNRHSGFTLAETLITILIIGIVAVLTIPTIITRVQEYGYKQAWKTNFSILNTAFNAAKRQADENGIGLNDGMQYNEFCPEYLKLIQQQLKVADWCGLAGGIVSEDRACDNYGEPWRISKYPWSGILGHSVKTRYKCLNGYELNGYDFNSRALLLENGAAIYFGGLWSGTSIVVDVNNFTKGPNTLGKDVFAIRIIKEGSNYKFVPYGATETVRDGSGNYLQTGDISGSYGCGLEFGLTEGSNRLDMATGAGCSAKYLYE